MTSVCRDPSYAAAFTIDSQDPVLHLRNANPLHAKLFRPEILYKVERLSHTVGPIGAYSLIRQFCSLDALHCLSIVSVI
jgi:hypothetical protein